MFHDVLPSICFVLFSMLVRCEIKPNAITPHPLPSIGFPIQNHLPGVVLPRAPSTHAFRVLPNTIALVQVMPVISYQIAVSCLAMTQSLVMLLALIMLQCLNTGCLTDC